VRLVVKCCAGASFSTGPFRPFFDQAAIVKGHLARMSPNPLAELFGGVALQREPHHPAQAGLPRLIGVVGAVTPVADRLVLGRRRRQLVRQQVLAGLVGDQDIDPGQGNRDIADLGGCCLDAFG